MTDAVFDIADWTWNEKYRFNGAKEVGPKDERWSSTAYRVVYSAYPEHSDWNKEANEIHDSICNKYLLPGGRILAGAGTGRQVTLQNCFVSGPIPDSLEGIYQRLFESMSTLKAGGGIGHDFSTLRPAGALVEGVNGKASGPVSFMRLWDQGCATIMSTGNRHGAMMGCLRVDHPEIEAFIRAKTEPGVLTRFNLSVLVTDHFISCVKFDDNWDLKFNGEVYRTVRARELWDLLMRTTYDYAEPGVIFIDRVNSNNNLGYCEEITATNPCGEQPLPPLGQCTLASINLAKMVKNPFTPTACVDWKRLEKTTYAGVRLLNRVLDTSFYPLGEQQREAKAKRRIGLGITGLASLLQQLGETYGSESAINITQSVMYNIRDHAYWESIRQAELYGPFPAFEKEKYLEEPFIRKLPGALVNEIERFGIRNGVILTIAPTGTISLIADNVSSGCEPVFSQRYKRTIRDDNGTREVWVLDWGFKNWCLHNGHDPETFDLDQLPPHMAATAQTINVESHVKMQAAVQELVDSAVSKTVNCPANISFDEFQDVYMLAYDLDCKGCTTYRPNPESGRGAILTVETDGKATEPAAPESPIATADAPSTPISSLLLRPSCLRGATYKIKPPTETNALYITINDTVIADDIGGKHSVPFEIFVNSKEMNSYQWTVALTRMISAIFRRGGDVSFVVDELKSVFDPSGGFWSNGHYEPSVVAAIGRVLNTHLTHLGLSQDQSAEQVDTYQSEIGIAALAQCPNCATASLIRSEGCDKCLNCSYSNCA